MGSAISENEEKMRMSYNMDYSGIAREDLESIVQRVERLNEEKANIADDIKQLFGEAKARGFDIKVIKRIVQDRKMDSHTREEFEYIYNTYRQALGMLPLFDNDETENVKIHHQNEIVETNIKYLRKAAK